MLSVKEYAGQRQDLRENMVNSENAENQPLQ
jgi:hypothetical protein